MSYDLLVLTSDGLNEAEVRERVAAILKSIGSGQADPASAPDARIAAFHTDITGFYPADAEGDDLLAQVPWSVPPEVTAPDWLYLCIAWPRAEELHQAVDRLAAEHGLVLYDPQSDALVRRKKAPVLRATTESGDTIDDPSEDALFILFENVERGASSYLIVDALSDPTGHTYAQTSRNEDGSYIVEYRDGSPDRHFGTTATDMRSAHALINGWAHQVPGWQESAHWSPVSF